MKPNNQVVNAWNSLPSGVVDSTTVASLNNKFGQFLDSSPQPRYNKYTVRRHKVHAGVLEVLLLLDLHRIEEAMVIFLIDYSYNVSLQFLHTAWY